MPTLKKYIEDLQKFADKHPELLNKPVGYMTDDEGNGFSTNIYKPTLTYYNPIEGERICESDYVTYLEDDEESVEGFKQYVVIN